MKVPPIPRVRLILMACLAPVTVHGEVSFNRDVRPILQRHCTACHGGIKASGGLSFVYREKAITAGKSGLPAIVPGDPGGSELVRRIRSDDPEERMPEPSHGPRLSDTDIHTIEEWIREGAVWEEHWSFVAPEEPPDPAVRSDWPESKADRLVLAAMQEQQLSPSPEASLAEWLRRASLDLTGLPATPEDLERLESEAATDRRAAMAAAVDRLLASPHFGERWATIWLDLARYSDTTGFEKDPHRNIWPYRDWVIRAFNEDMPFDEFTLKQLAGDLIPDPAPDDLIATAFHRNTQNNTEGGTDDEEFRIAAVIDRVNTTWTAWTATTFGCVQCHDHPYDPIPHRDYYRFLAFFNNTEDADLNSEYPLTKVAASPERQAEALDLERRIRSLRQALNDQALAAARELKGWTGLKAESAAASADTGTVSQEADGTFVSGGTHPNRSVFTIVAPVGSLAALRIDILPVSDDPAKWMERGAVVTKLEAEILLPDGSREPVKFREVICDYVTGPLEPNGILDGKNGGIGDFPALHAPRFAFAVPETPVTLPPDARLEIRLHQSAVCNGDNQSCVLRRFRLSVTGDGALAEALAAPERAAQWEALRAMEKRHAEIPGLGIPVMLERPEAGRRETRVFHRGSRSDRGEPVTAGIPDVVAPPAHNANLTRIDLARWLTSPSNPLTARVLANRLWEAMFGTGIVETTEDFGSSGALPVNQPLLDHLALRLSRDHAWHLKPFLREIALSATYRQTGRITPDRLARDPANRYLSRGPRQRLTAEMVRDQALVVSGLFSPKMFGPPVFPPQPDGIWRSVYNSEKWTTSTGEDRYRRAIYTYVKRTSGYPSYLTFDAPARDVCSPRRIPTNTPLQALVTLNDPAFLELGQGFAKRMMAAGDDTASRISAGHYQLTLQRPSQQVLAALTALHHDALQRFESEPAAVTPLAPTADEAALVLVANTLFNMDSALTR